MDRKKGLGGLESAEVLHTGSIKKLFKKLKLFLDVRHRIITGLDIDGRVIKLVQLKTAPSGTQAVKCVSKEVDFNDDLPEEEREDILVNALKEIFHENKIKAKFLITALPRDLAVVRYITLPSGDEAEIRQMIKFEAERHIPFPIDKVEIDFQIINKGPEESEIFLVAAKKELIDRRISLLEKAGVIPSVIDLSSFAVFNSFINSDDKAAMGAVALIDVGQRAVEINIVRDGLLCFTRSALFGENKNSQNSLWKKTLLDEIKRSFDAFKVEPRGSDIDRIVLSGEISSDGKSSNGLKKSDNLEFFLKENLDGAVEQANPFNKIQFVSSADDKQNLASFMPAAVGLALRKVVRNKIEINLLPSEFLSGRKKEKRKRFLQVSGFLAGFIIFLAAGFTFGRIYTTKARLKDLNSRIEKLKPTVLEARKMQAQIELISFYTENQSLCLEILRELSLKTVIPDEVYLTNLVFGKDKSVNIRGITTSHSIVSQIVVNLKSSPFFENIERRFSRANKMSGRDVVEFEIYCPLAKRSSSESIDHGPR